MPVDSTPQYYKLPLLLDNVSLDNVIHHSNTKELFLTCMVITSHPLYLICVVMLRLVLIPCRGHYFCSVYASRLMVAQGKGLIVMISSMGGLRYLFNVAYGVGKAAVSPPAYSFLLAHLCLLSVCVYI